MENNWICSARQNEGGGERLGKKEKRFQRRRELARTRGVWGREKKNKTRANLINLETQQGIKKKKGYFWGSRKGRVERSGGKKKPYLVLAKTGELKTSCGGTLPQPPGVRV